MKHLEDGHTQTYVEGKGGKPGHYQYTHILVAEKKYGRKLRPGEIVHHIDENPSNNAPSNLKIITQGEHNKEDASHHQGGRTKGSKNGHRASVNYNHYEDNGSDSRK